MFGIGFFEIVIILIIGLILLGPQEFPKVARKFLKSFYSFKKTFEDIRAETKDLEYNIKKTISESEETGLEEKKIKNE